MIAIGLSIAQALSVRLESTRYQRTGYCPPMPAAGGGRSFSAAVNDQLRSLARELRKKHPSDHAFARELKAAQPTVTNFLNGGGAGIQLALAIGRVARVPICFSAGVLVIGGGDQMALWSSRAWWPEAIAKAKALFPFVGVNAWEWLGALGGAEPPQDPVALGSLAATWDQVQARAAHNDATRSQVRQKARAG